MSRLDPRSSDPLRLALGTLTVVRVGPPAAVDRQTAGRAMLLAPVAALPLALAVAVVCGLGALSGVPALATAGLALGSLALASRGMHLDGLADTADGLASSYDRERALTVMRTGDVGPAGAGTLLLVLLVQAGSLQQLVAGGGWAAAVVPAVAVVLSRSVLPLECVRGVPAARASGLGATVAGSVSVGPAVAVVLVAGALGGLLVRLAGGSWWTLPVALAAGLAGAALLLTRCVRRIGGITGDVLGACVEATFTGLLVVLATVA